MKTKLGIVTNIRDIQNRSQALNYCLLPCPHGNVGCAIDCELRKKWKIPPHGDQFYEENRKKEAKP
jgi:hypothetical protein